MLGTSCSSQVNAGILLFPDGRKITAKKRQSKQAAGERQTVTSRVCAYPGLTPNGEGSDFFLENGHFRDWSIFGTPSGWPVVLISSIE